MKQILMVLLGGILFLTACGQAPTSNIPTALISVTESNTNQSSTSSPLPTKTPRERANEPTITPRPLTPLPTIPTFTPTFDARTIVTVTPAPKAECPKANSSILPTFTFPQNAYNLEDITTPILDYLNSGGSLGATVAALQKAFPTKHKVYMTRGSVHMMDVNGDTTPELITDVPYLWIAGCISGKYEILYSNLEASEIENIVSVRDLNLDNLAEIVFYDVAPYAASTFYRILEWDGNHFSDLISDNGDIEVGGSFTEAHLKDIDGNGVEELIMDIGIRGNIESVINGPLRKVHKIFTWNGHSYVLSESEFSAPEYRFQAVQDGDREVLNGSVDKAMSLYQESIQSDQLDWWSKDRSEYIKAAAWGTSFPVPTPDLTEYPRLAAYAYYRIVLLHLVQNHESDATTVYNTLQQKFSGDKYGHPYYEMATEFWNAYHFTHRMYDGCAAAIGYAAEHPEILTPLGSDYHGSQSHTYVPADVCPFR